MKNGFNVTKNITETVKPFLLNEYKIIAPLSYLKPTDRVNFISQCAIDLPNKSDALFLAVMSTPDNQALVTITALKPVISKVLALFTLKQLVVINEKITDLLLLSTKNLATSDKYHGVIVSFDVRNIHLGLGTKIKFDANNNDKCLQVEFEEKAKTLQCTPDPLISDCTYDYFPTQNTIKASLHPFDLVFILNASEEDKDFIFHGVIENQPAFIYNDKASFFARYQIAEGMYLIPAMALYVEAKIKQEDNVNFIKTEVLPAFFKGGAIGTSLYFTGGSLTAVFSRVLTGEALNTSLVTAFAWLGFDIVTDYVFLSGNYTPQEIEDYNKVFWAVTAIRIIKSGALNGAKSYLENLTIKIVALETKSNLKAKALLIELKWEIFFYLKRFFKSDTKHIGGTILPKDIYKTHRLSSKVFEERKRLGDWGVSNYACYEYKDLQGKVQYIVKKSQGGGFHSEEVCEEVLRTRGIPNENVLAIYSERTPCFPWKDTHYNASGECLLPNKIGCKARIETNFPNAPFYNTWDFGIQTTTREMKDFFITIK